MHKNRFIFALVAGFLLVLSPSIVLADGTLQGRITGKVTDERGGALPGATVDLKSADKGFGRTATTDATGSYNFALLQPGPYNITISLAGFETFVASNSMVEPDKTTTVSVSLKIAKVAETVTVVGETPLVDKTNTTATTVVSSQLTDRIPVARGYQSLIPFAPGVTDPTNGGNPNSHGALSGNNLYLFDGVDTTDVTTGTFGQNFTFDAIQEVAVSTTGISAEYGRSQGAVVNVVTKSGTNRFSGSVKVFYTNDSWNDQNKGSFNGVSFARQKNDTTVPDYNYTLGGPIWPDHIWFFGAYETNKQVRTAVQTNVSSVHPDETGQSAVPHVDVRLWDGKITAQVLPSQLLTGQFNSDPITGFIIDYWQIPAPSSAELQALTAQGQNQCSGLGCLKQISWSGVFGSKVSGEARYAEQAGNITVGSYLGNGAPFFNLSDGLYYNGATFNGIVDRPRKQGNLAFSIFQDLGGSQHQFKLGVDYQDLKSVSDFHYPQNQVFYVADFDPKNRANPVFAVGDIRQDFIPGPSVSTGKIWGGYALDKFDVGRFAFNVGLRVENQTSKSDLNNTVIDTTNWSPRVTATYDVNGNGKTLVSAAYGRYYQFLVQNIADSIFAGVPQQTNFDQFVYDGTQFVFDKSVRAGGNNATVNQDLGPSYADEFNISFQQQLGNTMAVGARGVYRKWNQIVDDAKVLLPDGTLFQTPQNFGDELRRYYKGIELTFEKRFSDRWQVLANYTLSRSEGNQFANFASQLFDFPGSNCTIRDVHGASVSLPCTTAESVNQYGLSAFDRTHILNVFASYLFQLGPVNLTAAPVFNYQSGLPYQRQRTSLTPINSTYSYFYDPRGSYRTPSTYRVDFSLDAAFAPMPAGSIPMVTGPLEFGGRVEIFNVTNQQEIARNDRISVTPNFKLADPFQFFGQATSRTALQAPRNYRVSWFVRF
jgi:hypothetical protein